MSARKDAIRIRHMLEAARKAVEFARGRTRADLDSDELLSLALVRLLEVIGEAGRQVSADVRKQYSHIPWREIVGTRDRLIHGYFDVDMDIVWAIISTDLPALIPQLEELLRDLSGPEDSSNS